MKIIVLFIFLLYSLSTSAQQNLDPYDSNFIQYRFKGYVVLNNKQKIKIEGLSFIDSLTVRLYSNTSGPKTIPAAYKGDVRNMEKKSILVMDIKTLKGKRMSFVKGAGVGAPVGYGAGYLAGYLTYKEDFYLSDEENEEDQKARGAIFGILGAIPVGVITGLIGSVVVQRKFTVNGERHKLNKALDKLYK